MTSQTLQTMSQVVLAVGIFLSAIGTFGAYFFGQRAQRERENTAKEIAAKNSRPSLSRLFINLPTTKEVGLWIENHGGGVAYLTPYDIIINGDIKSKHSIQTLDDWRTALKRLEINDPWVTMGAIRGQIAIEPGNKILVLRMAPSEFSRERYQQFIEAVDRMEFHLSYKSSTGEEFTLSFDDLD